jgi:hypothetical protein
LLKENLTLWKEEDEEQNQIDDLWTKNNHWLPLASVSCELDLTC